MKIGIIPIESDVSNGDDINKTISPIIESIENKLKEKIDFINISQVSEYDITPVLVKTGGSEMKFRKIFEQLPQPIIIMSYFQNNSLPASLEILSYIKEQGGNGEIITGEGKDIANKLKEIYLTNKVDRNLNKIKVGVIGKPSDWLIASEIAYNEVISSYGIEFVDIDIEEVISEIKKTEVDEELKNSFIKNANKIEEPNTEEIGDAIKVYSSLEKIVKKYNIDIFTIRCFDLVSKLKITGCYALSKFNDIGVVAGCEGDIPALISLHIGKLISDQSCFMANPSSIDTNNNIINLSHCTIPLSMTKEYKIRSHFETELSVGIQGYLEKSKVTVFKIGGKKLDKIFFSTGEILDNVESNKHCRTHISIKLDKNVDYFLKNPIGNHHIIVQSDIADILRKFANRKRITIIE